MAMRDEIEEHFWDRIDDLLIYFINTWVSENSQFQPSVWNHFGNFEARTINHLEGFHNRFAKRTKKKHPNIFHFISNLKKEQESFESQVQLLINGNNAPRINNKYRKINRALLNLKIGLESDELSLEQYLTSVAIHLS